MPNITLQVLNPDTGESMDGQVAYISNKHRIFKDGYVSISQPAIDGLVENEKLPLPSYRLWIWLLKFVEHNNKIPLIGAELIRLYPYSAASFYSALKPLLNERIIVVDRKQGSNVYYALNSDFGWKGKLKNYHINDPENPLYDADKASKMA